MYYGMFDKFKTIEKMDIGQIMKARKHNQRAKAQRRGRPTAGIDNRDIGILDYYYGGPNKFNDKKRNCNWKAKRKSIKRAKVEARRKAA